MKTEEIIFALRCTSSVPQIDHDCGKCPYHEAAVADGLGEFDGCDVDQVALDAADRLEQLKREQEQERPRPLPLDELQETPTNADRIRAMNDENLCNWLFRRDCTNIAAFLEYGGMGVMNAVQLLEWLKQPAEEDSDETD